MLTLSWFHQSIVLIWLLQGLCEATYIYIYRWIPAAMKFAFSFPALICAGESFFDRSIEDGKF